MMRVAIYTRLSREDGNEESQSINNSKKKRNVCMEIKFVCCNEMILEFLNLDRQTFYTY